MKTFYYSKISPTMRFETNIKTGLVKGNKIHLFKERSFSKNLLHSCDIGSSKIKFNTFYKPYIRRYNSNTINFYNQSNCSTTINKINKIKKIIFPTTSTYSHVNKKKLSKQNNYYLMKTNLKNCNRINLIPNFKSIKVCTNNKIPIFQNKILNQINHPVLLRKNLIRNETEFYKHDLRKISRFKIGNNNVSINDLNYNDEKFPTMNLIYRKITQNDITYFDSWIDELYHRNNINNFIHDISDSRHKSLEKNYFP